MFPTIQTSFVSGELSPSFFGRADKPQYKNGASTMRNCFVRYTGGASSRAGFAYIGMCKQGAPNSGGTATSNPPRDINFQYNINQGFALEFGDQYMRVKYRGQYITETAKNITAITHANPAVITSVAHGFVNGDWVYIAGVGGVTQLNGLTWIVTNKTNDTFRLTDLFGNVVDSSSFSAYTSGGTAARIYTVVSPYAAVDLPYLKFVQRANAMNLTCWNPNTNAEYPPYTLVRNSNISWTFSAVQFAASIAPPTTVTATPTSSAVAASWYSYIVTAVDENGNESIASAGADVLNNNISVNLGSNTIEFSHVAGATSYNIYAATPIYTPPPYTNPKFVGASYGYIGTSFGQKFVDSNIIVDFTKTPPLHLNPFARGAITDVSPTAGGAGYSQATVGYTVTTVAGSGFLGEPVVQSGAVVGFVVKDGGSGYASGDSIAITGGAGATVSLSIGALTGTYPGSVQYFQQRLVYSSTINQPDTYFMSQPGSYNNFDSAIPSVDSDAIIGTPWGVQINGIQFLVPTISGLLALTGNGVWLISGGSATAITPSNQSAQAQAQIGCSAIIPPLYVNLHILYAQAKNSIIRDVAYNFINNVFQGTDLTLFSGHLFSKYTLLQWCYAEEPYKVIWAVRDDGVLLSLTYVKEQEIEGWARHDTNGFFVGVCNVVEPPVDAVYVITKRYIVGEDAWVFYSERADNREWNNIEDCFCVDAGLSLPMTYPNAEIYPAAGDGTRNISSTNLITGGSGYTNPVASVIDSSGLGSGAVFSVTVSSGVITAVTPISEGSNYTEGAMSISITDSTGSGAVVQAVITNNVAFSASASVFTSAMVGNVLRVGGGKAIIVSQTGTGCVANIVEPITSIVPNDKNNKPSPVASGDWTVSTPVTEITGLNHLEGMQVTGLADGGVIVPVEVVGGSITLPNEASLVTLGLPFVAQIQTMYLEPASKLTVQGKRKNIQSTSVRMELSRGVQVGINQPDSSVLPNNATITWANMKEIKERNALINAGSSIPLFTGDSYILVPGDWDTKGQLAMQQVYPMPMNALAAIINFSPGDSTG